MPHTGNYGRDTVDQPSIAYTRMAESWVLLHDLLGGTRAMRAAKEKWLPKEQQEKDGNYIRRLARSVLFEGYKNAIDRAVSRPFSRPITLKSVPESLAFLEGDADACDQSLSQFARTIFQDLTVYGKAHILVDFATMPQNVDPNAAPATLKEEAEAGARASFVRVSPPSLIGWTFAHGHANDHPELAQIRVMETRIEPESTTASYADKEVRYVRVISREGWELWRERETQDSNQEKELFELVEEGLHTMGRVPLVTIYSNKVGPLEAEPPLEGLAWMNLAHYQSDSDQRNILRVSRFAILFASGMSKEEAEKGFTVGPFNTISSSSKEARLTYVEHEGTAIEAGRLDLKDLEARMEVLGSSPFTERSSQSTATGKAIDEASNTSKAQEWVRALEDGLFEAFELAAQWHSTDLAKDFGVDIFSDFKVSLQTGDLDFLLKTAIAGFLSQETFLAEIKRRGQLADSIDPEEELLRIEKEGDNDLPGTPTLPEPEPEPEPPEPEPDE